MSLRKSIIINLLLIILTAPLSLFSQSDTLEIPFFEDWSSGSLDTNGWTASDSNWSVNSEVGYPEPSVQFDARELEAQYGSNLISSFIDARDISTGDVWLTFSVKLRSADSLQWGRLSIYVSYGGEWHWFTTMSNSDGSFDWKKRKINISDVAKGEVFRLRIAVSGKEGAVDVWYVDNIHFYRTCDAPADLAIEIDTVDYDKYQLNLNWRMDESEIGWIHWDDGVNYDGIGFACTGKFCVAARWDTAQLADYDNYKISRIKAFLSDDGYDSLTFNICTGENGNEHVYSSDYLNPESDVWIEHIIDTAIYLNADLEYWIGYRANIFGHSVFPLGTDNGPAVAGYGDMLKSCGSETWDKLSDFGFDYNWNIQFYVEDTAGNEIQLGKTPLVESYQKNIFLGYNLYQSINGADYELLEFIPWVPGDTNHTIMFDASPDLYCYQLTALWTSKTDTCESVPAISKENPEEDFVCVLLVGEEQNKIEQSALVRCFPNPFSTSTTIEYSLRETSTVQITIFNHLGEQVDFIQQKQASGKQQVFWKANGLSSGMYYLIIETGSESMQGKMMILR